MEVWRTSGVKSEWGSGGPEWSAKGKPGVLGPRPEGLGGQTKSESGIGLGVHEIGTSRIVILVLRYNEYKMVP